MPKPPPIRISDHVLVRYVERVLGFDLEPARRELKELAEKAAVTGASAVTWNDVRLVVKPDSHTPGQFVVATALDKSMGFNGAKKSTRKFRISDRSEGRRISHQALRRQK